MERAAAARGATRLRSAEAAGAGPGWVRCAWRADARQALAALAAVRHGCRRPVAEAAVQRWSLAVVAAPRVAAVEGEWARRVSTRAAKRCRPTAAGSTDRRGRWLHTRAGARTASSSH